MREEIVLITDSSEMLFNKKLKAFTDSDVVIKGIKFSTCSSELTCKVFYSVLVTFVRH